jgi:hypothetical protein
MQWRFDVARRRPSHENHRWPPKEPAARPSVAPQRGAAEAPGNGNAWLNPLRQTLPPVRPGPSSQEELRELIKTEVARAYKLLREEATIATEQQKQMMAGKEAEIASLKTELEAVKKQIKSSAAAVEPTSPTDTKCQTGSHDWRQLHRELRQLRPEAREARNLCNGMKQEQFRMSTELVLQQQEIADFRGG